jgi:hypothetical protein
MYIDSTIINNVNGSITLRGGYNIKISAIVDEF